MAINKRSARFLLLLLACILVLLPSPALANDRQKVLILNSYHQIYFWTDSIMQGIREVFAEQGQTVDFYVENMDSKRFFDGRKEEYVAHLRELYRDKYAGLRLACIISSDDDALNFLLACRHELFPGVPIVFCGVNNFTDDLLAGQAGITGVIETLDRKETIDAALALHPGAKIIALVTDTATTGRGNRGQLEMLARQYAPAVDFVFLDPDGEGLAYDELLGKVKALPRDAIIFYSDFHLDKSGRAFDDQRLVATQLHQASGLPVYTNYASVFGPGTVGGKLNNPLFQGRTAAEMAVRILKGESVAAMPVRKESPNRFMFQDSQLKKFDISDQKLPPDSIVVNRPVTFYQQNKGKVWLTVFLLVMQSVIISFLLHTIRQRREGEKQLRLWASIFENAEWGIAVGDPEKGAIITANPAFARMHGYETAAEIIGLPVIDLYAQEERKFLPGHIRLAHEQGRHIFEARHLRRDGSTFPASVDVIAIRDERGKIMFRAVNVMDITERRQAAETVREKERLLSESQRIAHIGSWSLDIQGRIVWSDEAYRIYGVSPDTFSPEASSFLSLIHPDDQPAMQAWIKASLAGEKPPELIFRAMRPDGSVRFLCGQGELLRDDGNRPMCMTGTVQDITERKQAEETARIAKEKLHEETKRHAAELEQRVRDRTMELVRANEKLRELDRLKSMFIASMSHELRTPLNSIIGFSSILREEWLGPANAEQKENLSSILAAGKHLLSLINDVIDLSKIEAGMLASEAETFDLRDLIAEAVGAIKKDARDKGVKITADVAPITLNTDRRRLLQCLLNLLGNAVKFTEAGEISVTVRQEDDTNDGRMLAIAVRDTGIGIRAADIDKLFEPFVRLHPPGDARYPGTGLGLYLTAKLVREVLMGGIAVTSEFGQGSTFTIRIPAGSGAGEGETSTRQGAES